MKRFWTLLTVLVLALGQGFAMRASGASVRESVVCTHCDCGGRGCCTSAPSPASSPDPATPPPPSGQNGQELAGVLCRALATPALPAPDSPPFAQPAAPLPPPSVPLHARNCCFLI